MDNNQRIVYSSVLEPSPKYVEQALVWCWSLLDLAEVPAEDVIINVVGTLSGRELRQFQRLGVRVAHINRFERNFPHCNKIGQLDNTLLESADAIVLCDTDIAFVESIESVVNDSVRAKVVDLPNPTLDVLRSVFQSAGFADNPKLVETTFSAAQTFANNCNGGLYIIPQSARPLLATSWTQWAKWLIERAELLGRFRNHVDQVSFALACHERKIAVDLLPLEYNCATHKAVQAPNVRPSVLHYHNNVDPMGRLNTVGRSLVDDAIDRVNQLIKKRRRDEFDNCIFWNFRYSEFPDLGSGHGSRGESLEVKRRIIKSVFETVDLGMTSVLDVGCGDIEVTKELDFGSYTGLDISETAIALASAKRPNWSFMSGDVLSADLEPHPYVLCLDVLIHQHSSEMYERMLSRLLDLTGATLIVAGYEEPPTLTSEITFYYEPLSTSLIRLKEGLSIEVLGTYRDTTILRVDVSPGKIRRTDIDGLPSVDGQAFTQTRYGTFVSKKNDLITEQFKQYRGHTRNELAMLLAQLKPGDKVIDVGAHIGSFAVPMAKAVGKQGRVVAIEPQAENVRLLKKNIELNEVSDTITVIEGVVSDVSSRFRVVVDPGNTGAAYFVADPDGPYVGSYSVDEIWENYLCGERVALLKIDVEGQELAVLRAATGLLKCRPLIYVEIVAAQLARFDTTPADIERLLKAMGYLLYRNVGLRNSDNDEFRVEALGSIEEGGAFFDCLAVPEEMAHLLVRTSG